MTQLTDKHCAVEVPDDAQDFIIKSMFIGNKDQRVLCYWNGRGSGDYITLPFENADFICTSKDAVSDQAKLIVSECGVRAGKPVYKDYSGVNLWTAEPTESLHSLLRSKGLDENKNYALIEKM